MRAATLTGYLEVARHVGLDPFELLREAGLTPDFLDDPEKRHAAGDVVELLEASAARSGCESLGLLMAECRSFAQLGPLSLLLERLPTVRDVVKALSLYRRHFNDILDIELEEDGDPCLIDIELLPQFAKIQIIDLTAARFYRNVSGASGGRWHPLSVHLVRDAPEDLSAFRRIFPCPVEFGSSFNGFSCTSNSLAVANPLANETMARHASRLLQMVELGPEDAPTSDQARRAIALLLPSGKATLEHVATNLGVSARALRRGLEREGHVFGNLLNEVRRDLAQRYLASSNHSITAISDLTGYTSLSSFSRWFAAEFGMAPHSWRSAQIAMTRYSALRDSIEIIRLPA